MSPPQEQAAARKHTIMAVGLYAASASSTLLVMTIMIATPACTINIVEGDGDGDGDSDGDGDADGDGDSDPGPCDGECRREALTSCTCAASDPCGWARDGACDYGCFSVIDSPFDDLDDCDDDLDRLYDDFEFEIAEFFAPLLVFSFGEIYNDRLEHWAVEPFWDDARISVFYALAYFEDGGDADWGGAYAHYGDTEFIVIDLDIADDRLTASSIFLSAHYLNSLSDGSGWHAVSSFELADSGDGSHPVVWVAHWKHANYLSAAACDAGAGWQDSCDDGFQEFVAVDPGRNLGNPVVPLIDAVTRGGATVYFWSHGELPFCGWNVGSMSVSMREAAPCAPAANAYANELEDWYDGFL